MGTITSSDDASQIPDSDGFNPKGDFVLNVTGGTTIDAVLQKKSSEGNWFDIPDANSYQTIDAAYSKLIEACPDENFRINVTTATGTWDWSWSKKLER